MISKNHIRCTVIFAVHNNKNSKALLILSAKKADIIDQDIMLSAIDEFIN